ncbi:uncharacterized protein CANTADRAFT_25174 [Suhomyces tanzawaensis NRRL Y-17324]|uniref:PCI domain-containing protein n=1 Tax=Suhomyces tanzawaensis NRRL Y-17324 TaxID=984487 RepID=A0A1E4SML6_9ASCO|nr:uncharacterized protein CANTADRAFT_25174 [Suhomyces tanzawaensis NRRL Y-17324]ODV80760.1 hypothetical protein CANTADRAFT_25174 [Suhomyces tanzawaensis NRRL Y-17324]
MENNLMLLSKYYRSVRISKIYDIFRLPPHLQVEEILVSMIVGNKLPYGTRIDQLKGVLVFGKEEKIADEGINRDIKMVAKLLNEVCSHIESRTV